MTTDLERFCAVVAAHPLIRGDAAVVLCGEDATHRANTASELVQHGVVPVLVCSGGLHDPPHKLDGTAVAKYLLTTGLAPAALLVESTSRNTYEQAVHVHALAAANGWTTLLLVASAYHLPRAMLTFLTDCPDPVRLVPVAAMGGSWFEPPPGMTTARVDLLASEHEKIARYPAHCATPAAGLAHLRRWR